MSSDFAGPGVGRSRRERPRKPGPAARERGERRDAAVGDYLAFIAPPALVTPGEEAAGNKKGEE
jgi:hypothetical protein